jgi:hypothetical protein
MDVFRTDSWIVGESLEVVRGLLEPVEIKGVTEVGFGLIVGMTNPGTKLFGLIPEETPFVFNCWIVLEPSIMLAWMLGLSRLKLELSGPDSEREMNTVFAEIVREAQNTMLALDCWGVNTIWLLETLKSDELAAGWIFNVRLDCRPPTPTPVLVHPPLATLMDDGSVIVCFWQVTITQSTRHHKMSLFMIGNL